MQAHTSLGRLGITPTQDVVTCNLSLKVYACPRLRGFFLSTSGTQNLTEVI